MPEQAQQVPIADGLFTWPSSDPRLIASRCTACGEVAFPAQPGCPACTGEAVEEILLSRRGQLWTWTIQRFPPPPPFIGSVDPFEPYGVGYVEMPEGVRVEARLTTANPEDLKIGMNMDLVIEPFGEADTEGRARMSFAFAPASV